MRHLVLVVLFGTCLQVETKPPQEATIPTILSLNALEREVATLTDEYKDCLQEQNSLKNNLVSNDIHARLQELIQRLEVARAENRVELQSQKVLCEKNLSILNTTCELNIKECNYRNALTALETDKCKTEKELRKKETCDCNGLQKIIANHHYGISELSKTLKNMTKEHQRILNEFHRNIADYNHRIEVARTRQAAYNKTLEQLTGKITEEDSQFKLLTERKRALKNAAEKIRQQNSRLDDEVAEIRKSLQVDKNQKQQNEYQSMEKLKTLQQEIDQVKVMTETKEQENQKIKKIMEEKLQLDETVLKSGGENEQLNSGFKQILAAYLKLRAKCIRVVTTNG